MTLPLGSQSFMPQQLTQMSFPTTMGQLQPAPTAQPDISSILQALIAALQSGGLDSLGGGTDAFTPTSNFAVQPGAADPAAGPSPSAATAPAPSLLRSATTDGLGFYIKAVDQGGNVNQDEIKKGGANTAVARSRIVEGYASEFVLGKRVESADDLAQADNLLFSALNDTAHPNAQHAAQFALIASRYKNDGGNYNNGKIKDILDKTGNGDLIGDGVGNNDVQTLHAVVEGIARGTLNISDIYNGTDQDAVDDDNKYDAAIYSVTKLGDLGTNLDDIRKTDDFKAYVDDKKEGRAADKTAAKDKDGMAAKDTMATRKTATEKKIKAMDKDMAAGEAVDNAKDTGLFAALNAPPVATAAPASALALGGADQSPILAIVIKLAQLLGIQLPASLGGAQDGGGMVDLLGAPSPVSALSLGAPAASKAAAPAAAPVVAAADAGGGY